MPPAKKGGTIASKLLVSPAAPPSPGGQHCRGRRLRTAKKMGVFPKHPPFDASSPHRRGQQQGDGRNTYQSSPSRQNDDAVRQPRKSRGPTLCSLAAFTPCWGDLMFARAHHLRHRHKRPLRRGALRPPKGRRDLVTASAVSDLIPALRRVKAPGHQQIHLFRVQQQRPRQVSTEVSTPTPAKTATTALGRLYAGIAAL